MEFIKNNFFKTPIYGQILETKVLIGTIYTYIEEESKEVKSAETFSNSVVGATLLLLIIQIALGGSLEFLWTMINAFQLIAMLPFLSLKMPGFLLAFFRIVNSFNFGLQFVDFGSILSDTFSIDASFEGFSEAFSSLGLISDNVFSELSDVMLFTFSGLALFLASALLYFLFKRYQRKQEEKRIAEKREKKRKGW